MSDPGWENSLCEHSGATGELGLSWNRMLLCDLEDARGTPELGAGIEEEKRRAGGGRNWGEAQSDTDLRGLQP